MKQIYGSSQNGNLKEAARGITNPQLLLLLSNLFTILSASPLYYRFSRKYLCFIPKNTPCQCEPLSLIYHC